MSHAFLLSAGATAIAAGLLALQVESPRMTLAAPLCGLFAVALAFAAWMRRIGPGAAHYCELGVVFGAIVCLYAAYPLTGFVVTGARFSSLGDARLLAAQPSATDIARIGWYYVIFAACFAAAYIVGRGRYQVRRIDLAFPGNYTVVIIILLILLTVTFVQLVKVLAGVGDPKSYGEQYLAYSRLPLLLHQIANHLGGVVLALNLFLLTALMTRWQSTRWLIFAWLAAEALLAIWFPLGARTRLFLLLFGFAVNYHLLVRALPLRVVAAGALAGMALFVVLGALRTGRIVGDMDILSGMFLGVTEFESLFVNAVDLERLRGAGRTQEVLPALYFVDFLRLVPQQLLPWDKLDPAKWYVTTFYPDYAQIGGGLAFGVVAEAVVGLGIPDLAWRGAALGVLFAIVQRHFGTGPVTYLRFVLYTWIVVLSYQSLRSTTFTLVALFVYQFLPAAIAVGVLTRAPRSPTTS